MDANTDWLLVADETQLLLDYGVNTTVYEDKTYYSAMRELISLGINKEQAISLVAAASSTEKEKQVGEGLDRVLGLVREMAKSNSRKKNKVKKELTDEDWKKLDRKLSAKAKSAPTGNGLSREERRAHLQKKNR